MSNDVQSSFLQNVTLLEKQIEQDMNKGCVPLIVLATAGSTQCGQCDNIDKISDLCREKNIWLHFEGHSLAAMVLGAGLNTVSESCCVRLRQAEVLLEVPTFGRANELTNK